MNKKLKIIAGLTLPILVSCNADISRQKADLSKNLNNSYASEKVNNSNNICLQKLANDEFEFYSIMQELKRDLEASYFDDLRMAWEKYKEDNDKNVESIGSLIYHLHEALYYLNTHSANVSDDVILNLLHFIEKLKIKSIGVVNQFKFEYDLFSQSILDKNELENDDTTFANHSLARSVIEIEARNQVKDFAEVIEQIKKENNLSKNYAILFHEIKAEIVTPKPVANNNHRESTSSHASSTSNNSSSESNASAHTTTSGTSSNRSENIAVHFTAEPASVQVSFVNTGNASVDASDHVIVKIQDKTKIRKLLNFKEYFNKNINLLKPHINASNNKLELNTDFNEGMVLNAALAMSAIWDFVEFKKQIAKEGVSEDFQTLYKMLMVHSYLGFAQMGVDSLSALSDFVQMYHSMSAANLQQHAEVYSQLGRVFTRASNFISLSSVILDVAKIVKARNVTEKIQFSTQLAFDSVGLGMGLTNVVLRTLGATTASSVLGTISVPLAGLSVGLTGFAGASVQAQESAILQAKYFFDYEKDHFNYNPVTLNTTPQIIALPYKNIDLHDSEGKVIKADFANVVVNSIDLRELNTLKLGYGTHKIYETENNLGLQMCIFKCIVKASTDKNTAIPIRTALNFTTRDSIPINNDSTAIILPIVPESYISYSYNYTPFILTRGDAELTTVRRLENTGRFIFDYIGPL